MDYTLGELSAQARQNAAELDAMLAAESLAKRFHETYEELAPEYGYSTRESSRVEWETLPTNLKQLMVATVRKVCFPA